MTLTVRCVKCGRTLKVKPDFAGRTIRCSSCQSPIKVPSADDEFGDIEQEDEQVEDQRSAKQRRRSSSSDPSLLQKLAPYWFLGIPIISGIVTLLSPMLGVGLGLLTLVAGVLLAAYGFLSAVLVDPVYALSPIARMARSDAERKRIWKQMGPYFGSFGKGLLITAIGGLSAWMSFEIQDRATRKAMMKRMDESREREERRSPPRDAGSPFPSGLTGNSSSPGVPATTDSGTPPAMPSGAESSASPRPDTAPVQPLPGQPGAPLSPSPPVKSTRPVTPPVPRDQLLPNAVMFAWMNGGWRPVIILKVISEDRVSAIVPVFSADGQTQTSETQELPIEDLRTPNPGEIPGK